MMRNAGLWTLLVALALPGIGAAQEGSWTVQTNRGWIGLSVLYSTAVMAGDETTVAVIDGVVEGSPAEAAGIQVGDTLTRLDGQPISQRVLTSLRRSIEVGDLVRLTVLREGRPREILVEAVEERVANWIMAPNADQVALRLDEVSGAILESLDSLRLSIVTRRSDSPGEVSIRIVKAPVPSSDRAWLNLRYQIGTDTLRFARPEVMLLEPDLAVPFGALLASSQETTQLREELKRARGSLTESRRQELARIRELEASAQGPIDEAVRRDQRIREIRAREEALSEEVVRLNRRLEEVSQTLMRRQFAEIQARQEAALVEAGRALAVDRARSGDRREEYELRGPQHYVLAGQSFVAGAQLQPLNPDLAAYFQVEEGVLVTEVLEGTPAFEAGLLSGDVIVRVGGEKVSSLDDLRFRIGYFERPLRLQVVRKGAPVGIVIR